jgi:hypothetical protein
MHELTDPAIVAAIPALVELAKRAGMPVRFAGLAAIGIAVALYAVRDQATGSGTPAHAAAVLISGLIAGLAASGLYSQAKTIASSH